MFQESVGHGGVELLRLDEGRAHVDNLWLRHGDYLGVWTGPEGQNEDTGSIRFLFFLFTWSHRYTWLDT